MSAHPEIAPLEDLYPHADQSNWRLLLDLALPALDLVYKPVVDDTDPDWTFGGGTALAIWLKHRISKDIDIFITGGALRALAPANNPASRLISDTVQWPGHYLKFERAEGEVDFLSAALQTEPGFAKAIYKGRPIAIETPAEIIAKKIRYRAPLFKARDAFDLAATARATPGLEQALARYVPDRLDVLRDALLFLSEKGPEPVRASVDPAPAFESLPDQAVAECLALVCQAEKLVKPAPVLQLGPAEREG